MDFRYIGGLVIVFILGIGGGYVSFNNSDALNNTQNEVISIQTTLSELESDYNELQVQYTELMDNLESLNINYTSLSNQYSTLSSNSVELSVYNELNYCFSATIEEKDLLEVNISDLQSEFDELESEYTELVIQYDDLLSDYELVNGPESSYTSISDLEITLTTEKTVEDFDYPWFLSGNVILSRFE